MVEKHIHQGFKVELDDSEWAEYYPELFGFDEDLPLTKPSTAGREPETMLSSARGPSG